MSIEHRLASIGIAKMCLVFIEQGTRSSPDGYATELVAAALDGRPIVSAATKKPVELLGRDLLHALAKIPAEQSTLSEEEAGRLGAAISAINELSIELLDILDSGEKGFDLLDSVADKGTRPLLGVDLRTPLDGPPFGPSDERLRSLIRRAHLLGFSVMIAME